MILAPFSESRPRLCASSIKPVGNKPPERVKISGKRNALCDRKEETDT
jgi:hypothetical protein